MAGADGGDSPIGIDYVSPLPPVRSGISDYSADLLPHLAELCDLRVLRLAGQAVTPELEARWQPLPAAESLAAGSPRLPLYQMGNNRYHEEIGQLARRYPGVLTLHDLVLHHLLSEQTLGYGEFEPYLRRLAEDHGYLGEAAARGRRWGGSSDAALFSLPVHRGLAFAQRLVLVHSRWAAGVLAEEAPGLPVRVVPMGVPLPERADTAAGAGFRRRHGLPLEAPVLGSFGFQTPIKRTARVVEALARPGLESAHLLIAGQVSEHSDIEGTARRAGVAERVHVLGFVPFDDFEAAIAATDLCLNLRYPTAGETSASLLRVLAVGRPAVVSDYAQFAELPEEIVLKVPLGEDEVAVLASRLREVLAAPAALAAMGERARLHVARHHAPAAAAAAVVEACCEAAGREPVPAPPVAEVLPSTLTWSRLPGDIRVEGAGEPWPVGERRRLEVVLTNHGRCRWLAARRGPGGVAVEIRLEIEQDGRTVDLLAGRPWVPLARDLDPGESCSLPVEVRRPPQAAQLRFEPHVLGGRGFAVQGGLQWELAWPTEELS